jgi:hypothetical protein
MISGCESSGTLDRITHALLTAARDRPMVQPMGDPHSGNWLPRAPRKFFQTPAGDSMTGAAGGGAGRSEPTTWPLGGKPPGADYRQHHRRLPYPTQQLLHEVRPAGIDALSKNTNSGPNWRDNSTCSNAP